MSCSHRNLVKTHQILYNRRLGAPVRLRGPGDFDLRLPEGGAERQERLPDLRHGFDVRPAVAAGFLPLVHGQARHRSHPAHLLSQPVSSGHQRHHLQGLILRTRGRHFQGERS